MEEAQSPAAGSTRTLTAPGHRSAAAVAGLRPFVAYKARISAENRLGRGKPGSDITVLYLQRGKFKK